MTPARPDINIHPSSSPPRCPLRRPSRGTTPSTSTSPKAHRQGAAGAPGFLLRLRLTPAAFFGKGMSLSEAEVKRVLARGGNMFQMFHIGGGATGR